MSHRYKVCLENPTLCVEITANTETQDAELISVITKIMDLVGNFHASQESVLEENTESKSKLPSSFQGTIDI